MDLPADRRGQAIQIGAILLFAVLILALAIWQVQVIPSDNQATEFEHNQLVQEDLQDLRNGVLRAGSLGSAQPETVRLGTRYPQRILFINPPPPDGTVTAEPFDGELRIENATAVPGEGNTTDFWNGTDRAYTTSRIEYEPGYNELRNAPATRYEHSVVYNEFDNGEQVPVTGQRLIRGDDITLFTLDSEFERTAVDPISVDPEAVSVSTRTVTIEGDGDPITLVIPTELDAAEWEELLRDQIDDGNVESVTDAGGGAVEVVLDGTETYDLRMAKVTLDDSATEGAGEAYLTDVSIPEEVRRNATRQVVVEVRDEFNNPVSGVAVEADADTGSFESPTVTTNSEGRAVFRYTAPEQPGDDELRFSYANDPASPGFDGAEPENVAATIGVGAGAADGGDGGVGENPNPPGQIRFEGVQNRNGKELELAFTNRGSEDREIVEARLNFYRSQSQGKGNSPTEADISDSGGAPAATLEIGGEFETLTQPITFGGNVTETIFLEFDGNVNPNDWFIITLEYDNGEVRQYFISARD